ncbi:probable feruloyl esterase A [Aspergillus lentulus]|nr:probable feruloyl esterase A [Aspergillus lentulus]GFF27941.1 probable feruloyl esterase A [Aspergillus lentulus]GFF47895.1 probable feruloyl esterase A [Aspergillus lentulus]GFF76396.1 probable feruloyl esterase A [Aspergillus lentulus]GFG02738.1 probable feruloyl esterase A [Aspergillus lentulus]
MLHKYCLFCVTIFACFSGLFAVSVEGATFGRDDEGQRQQISEELFESLEELSRLVDVSYCVGTTKIRKPFNCLSHCSEFQGFELVTTWNTGPFLSDSCGYIALSHGPSPKRIIVAFRGTYSIANTIIDLSAYPQAYVPYHPEDGKMSGHLHCLNCTVHAGFLASWSNTRAIVLEHVAAARARYPDYSLVLVGHSLGGAVAALAGVEMQLRGWDPQVTTFGEPRIGNKAFVGFLDRIFDLDGLGADAQDSRFRRVTHVNDPVPLLPLQEWGYEMHAGEIFIAKVELSPLPHDIRLCQGDNDARCIAGADGAVGLVLKELDDIPLTKQPLSKRVQSPHQAFLADRVLHSSADADVTDHEQLQTPFSLPWHLIPSRYRLWELFFAHRDYFWRLGLCVPGGDPTGKISDIQN